MALRLQNMRDRKKDQGVKICPPVSLSEIDFIEPPPKKRLQEENGNNDGDDEEKQATLETMMSKGSQKTAN